MILLSINTTYILNSQEKMPNRILKKAEAQAMSKPNPKQGPISFKDKKKRDNN
jgi:hypothetical protein